VEPHVSITERNSAKETQNKYNHPIALSSFNRFTTTNHLHRWKELFLNEEMSDMTLVVIEHRIPVHRLVLALRSPVFKSMFFGNMK
jgi:hypothetical protein